MNKRLPPLIHTVISSELVKNLPPLLEDDRSTKKTKFYSEGDDGTKPQQMFFKDKLMEDHLLAEEDLVSIDNDLDFDSSDVVVETDGTLPSISFSHKIYTQIIKPWLSTVAVKLLGRQIGYKVLCNCLDSLWGKTQGFTIIDLENDYFLVRFRTVDDAYLALILVTSIQ